jgi:hypothetical protein
VTHRERPSERDARVPERERRTTAPPPEAAAAQIAALQRAAGNQAVQRLLAGTAPGGLLQRYSGDHPLADAVGLRTRDLKAQLGGEPQFVIVARWRLADLNDFFGLPAPVAALRHLAAEYPAADAPRMQHLVQTVVAEIGAADFVTLTAAQVAFLETQAGRMPLALDMLRTVGHDVGRATAIMQMLAPYIADPAKLMLARQELAHDNYDPVPAGPRIQFLVTYLANPAALALARQEYERDPATAAAEMAIHARYNYDAALRTQTEHKGAEQEVAVSTAGFTAAASAKTLAYQQAEVAETSAVAGLEVPEEPQGKRRNKTSVGRYNKAQTAYEKAVGGHATTRQQAEAAADAQQQNAQAAATQAGSAAKSNLIAGVEGFIANATTAHGEANAKFIIETADFDVARATAVLPIFHTLGNGRDREAQTLAGWALVNHGDDAARLARAVAMLQAAEANQLPTVLVAPVCTTLMGLTLAAGTRDRLLVFARDHAGEWTTASQILAHYPTRTADGTAALEAAATHHVALARLVPFGDAAHVFMQFAGAHPQAAFFRANEQLLLDAWPAAHADLASLCTALVPIAALPAPQIRVLAIDHPQQFARLATVPASLAHLVATAPPAAQLATNLPWYVQWFVDLAQPATHVTNILTAFPQLAERTRVIEGFTQPDLRAQLIAQKTGGSPLYARLREIVGFATDFNLNFGTVNAAIRDIHAAYAGGAQETAALYDLLVAQKVGRVAAAIIDARARNAPARFIHWIVSKIVAPEHHFYAHDNGFHEWLATDTGGFVTGYTMTLRRQKLASTSGSNTDILHIFDVTFTLTGGGPVYSELHNHVRKGTNRETSLHFKNGNEKGREMSVAGLSSAAREAVRASDRNTEFPGGYSI